MKIKAILFDVDNTLVDFMRMKHKSCESAIDAMINAGLKIKKDEALKILFELYEKHGIEYQKIFQKLLKRVNKRIDYRIMAHGIIAYRKVRETFMAPYPNTMKTLIELKKNYQLAIITDAPTTQAWMRIVAMSLEDFFSAVITKGDVRKQKTSQIPFKAALRKLNIKPEEALMVGDRISRDIETAKKLGIKTCYARYGDVKPAKPGKSGADWEINDISDILKIDEIAKS